jgi:hypothetical protein
VIVVFAVSLASVLISVAGLGWYRCRLQKKESGSDSNTGTGTNNMESPRRDVHDIPVRYGISTDIRYR